MTKALGKRGGPGKHPSTSTFYTSPLRGLVEDRCYVDRPRWPCT